VGSDPLQHPFAHLTVTVSLTFPQFTLSNHALDDPRSVARALHRFLAPRAHGRGRRRPDCPRIVIPQSRRKPHVPMRSRFANTAVRPRAAPPCRSRQSPHVPVHPCNVSPCPIAKPIVAHRAAIHPRAAPRREVGPSPMPDCEADRGPPAHRSSV
jgi:hypothetical protein